MKKLLAAIGAILLGSAPALADAFSDQYTGMVTRIPSLTPPYTTSDRLSVVRNGIPYKVPLPAIPISPLLNLYPANSYGSCTWDVTHDVGACINLAVAAAVAAGGGMVVCPAGTFGLSTMVRIQTSYVGLSCGAYMGTELKWIGSAGGRMVSVDAPYGDLTKSRLFSNVIDLWVDGNGGLAADGLYLASLFDFRLNFRANGVFNGGNVLSLDVVPAIPASTFLGAIDIQNGKIDYDIDVSGTSTSLYLGNYVTNPAGSHGNASFNDFYSNVITSNSATAILCYGCDNNTWHKGRVFNSNISVDLTFAQNGAGVFPSNGNKFLDGFYYSGSFRGRGTPTVATCTPVTINPGAASCTFANWIERDQTNGAPGPTIEAGADLKSGSNEGFLTGLSLAGNAGVRPGLVATESGATIQTCLAAAMSISPTGSLYLCNSSGAGVWAADNLAGDLFYARFGPEAAGVRHFQLQGTNVYEFVPAVQLDVGAFPATYLGTNLGSAALPFSNVYGKTHLQSNSSHTWALDYGLAAGTGDANATLTHDANPVLTFGSDLSVAVAGNLKLGTKLLISPTAPTIASGGCTTGSAQSVSGSNGSAAFAITLGGATCGSSITLTMPAAATGWVCDAHDNTTPASNMLDSVTNSATSVTLTNYVRTTGVAGNFTGGDVLAVKCLAY